MTSATVTDIAAMEPAIVDRIGVVPRARFRSAPITATTTESASAESVTAARDTLAKTVQSARAPTIATVLDAAMRTTPATVPLDGLDLIAHFRPAPRSAQETACATTERAFASLASLASTAPCLRARRLVLETDSVLLSETR